MSVSFHDGLERITGGAIEQAQLRLQYAQLQ
jgi:hypothetical protein